MSCVFVYVFCVDILGFVNMVVVVFIYLFLYLSIYNYTYGWYAMNYNFIHIKFWKNVNNMLQRQIVMWLYAHKTGERSSTVQLGNEAV